MSSLSSINKAIKYITNMRDKNYSVLDSFPKEAEENKVYSTIIYDLRIENCNIIIEALEKQIPKLPSQDNKCPSCGGDLVGFPYCNHCGQNIDFSKIFGNEKNREI